jgi:hypothetical protein
MRSTSTPCARSLSASWARPAARMAQVSRRRLPESIVLRVPMTRHEDRSRIEQDLCRARLRGQPDGAPARSRGCRPRCPGPMARPCRAASEPGSASISPAWPHTRRPANCSAFRVGLPPVQIVRKQHVRPRREQVGGIDGDARAARVRSRRPSGSCSGRWPVLRPSYQPIAPGLSKVSSYLIDLHV